ncbi:MAG: 3-methyl-2-oxobutanoate hydroxymethyltransferase [Alphaproteobacteria bacterium]|nr:3-methyl-2-oxobutanoate hydroxymethyltransferase [Alphaproteobacteria bacterium]
MSTVLPTRHTRLSVRDIEARKDNEPIVCITSYSAPMAKLMDEHVDVLLVGDTMGMVLYGLDNTLSVTVDMMVNHGAAVVRGSQTSCVIVDMPFGSYQGSPEAAFDAAAHIMAETGCAGVKLEGGCVMAETIEFLVARGIPVMGHVGMTPQSANVFGGFKTQGKSDDGARVVLEDAKAVEGAGAFSMVIEQTVEPVARKITEEVSIPTIGIGASPACDGQIIVAEDILGIFQDFTPKFVKRYAELGADITEAVRTYAEEVRARKFPGPNHIYGAKKS